MLLFVYCASSTSVDVLCKQLQLLLPCECACL